MRPIGKYINEVTIYFQYFIFLVLYLTITKIIFSLILQSQEFLYNGYKQSQLSQALKVVGMDALRMETVFDTLVLVHGDMSASDQSELEEWLIQYRHRVNPKLVLADVNVCASESYQKSKYATEGK